MIKKLFIILFPIFIFSLLGLSHPQKILAANNCTIQPTTLDGQSNIDSYLAESTSIAFKVTGSGLSGGNTPYWAKIEYGTGALNFNNGCGYDNGWGCNYGPQGFKVADLITFSNLDPIHYQVGAIGSVQQNHVEILIYSDINRSNLQCRKSIPVLRSNSGQQCSLHLSSSAGSNGKYWTTGSSIFLQADGFDPNLTGPFEVWVWNADANGHIVGNDPIKTDQQPVTKNSLAGTACSAGTVCLPPVEYLGGRGTFDAGTYVIGLATNETHPTHNLDNTLCNAATNPITQDGTDNPNPIGGVSCKFCPVNTYVSGNNPPFCQDIYGTKVDPKSGYCTKDGGAQQTCSPIFGCQDVTSYAASDDLPYVTPPCSLRDSDGNCTAISSGLGIQLPTDIGGFINAILGIVLSLSGGIATILIIVSGYRLMVSQGNPEKIQAAREEFTAAIVGLLFVIFSLVILTVLGFNILGIIGFS